MRLVAWTAALVIASGCGRIGFDGVVALDADAGADTDADADVFLPAMLGPTIRITNTTTPSRHASLAWTGDGFALAWRDAVTGTNEIWIANLDGDGSVRASAPFTNAAEVQDNPDVLWTGNQLGIAWQDSRSHPHEIYFATADGVGAPTSANIRLTDTASESYNARLAWTGDAFAMGWIEQSPLEARFQRFAADGTPIGDDVLVGTPLDYFDEISIEWTGQHYAIAWRDGINTPAQIRLLYLDANGTPLGPAVAVGLAGASGTEPALAWTGSELGIVYAGCADAATCAEYQLWFARADAAGRMIGAPLVLARDPFYIALPDLIWDGARFATAWVEDVSVQFARLSPEGALLESAIEIDTQQPGAAPSLAITPYGYGIAWEDNRGSSIDIWFRTITTR